ncbi:MAG: ribbon-helix-helix domain-containing protein, partial [Alphaproteobacteria bacterium]|nr:ribbon-helix-helix domain-containing protein [Alphaproteobacteria bacterium]
WLEKAFWAVLEELAEKQGSTLAALVTRIHDHCVGTDQKNLASCLRVVCLKYIETRR